MAGVALNENRFGIGARSRLLDGVRHERVGIALITLTIAALALLASQGAIPVAVSVHGMYVPIILAAYFYGLPGSLSAAIAGGAALVAAQAASGGAYAGSSPLFLTFYLLVALIVGRLLASIDERRKHLVRTQISMLKSFAVAVETEDEPAGAHCERVAANALTLGKALGLPRDELEELYWAGLLHDIGKVSVPREILRKPGGLTLEEYLVMRRHARLGASLLGSVDSFRRVAEGVGSHHERWDGAGYPGGLQGEAIPLFGRILAVVDVFEALSSDRPYRRALSREETVAELRRSAGSQFDPRLAEVYERLFREGKIQTASQPQAEEAEQPRIEFASAPQAVGGAS